MSAPAVAFVLASATDAERTATALGLAERLLARGARVTVYATGPASALAAGDGPVAAAVAALLRRGVHGGTLDWVVDAEDARRHGVTAHAAGVVLGDPSDLWSFVRAAAVVLAPGGGP